MDRCHLKWPIGIVLLSAVSLDANSGLFPLSVCIYEKETHGSWEWFLNKLKIYLNYPEGRNLTFMSGRQKGVIVALKVHFPFAHRRRMLMRKFNDRKEECSSWNSVLQPTVHAKILKHSRESRTLIMIAAENMENELLGASGGLRSKERGNHMRDLKLGGLAL
ncbi:hypothetical protein Ddye_005378 [Dipteronia dyeriana]|uniref:MULE transposase domain-containing protein n=1 Tax=Dipteronia dyeriana TaxID=168575 RepID=A0AAD9XG22_9ROSI|nr:hypothetical protein Ddye_005378 [Dipteronia dyeriana]